MLTLNRQWKDGVYEWGNEESSMLVTCSQSDQRIVRKQRRFVRAVGSDGKCMLGKGGICV